MPPLIPRKGIRRAEMKNKRSWLAAPYVVWMALFTVIPIVMMVVYAFTQEIVVDTETG